ncbi:transposase [Thauera sp. CAU 1555]|uniref:Transposase n=1 Tax=Thauera sedimentorum TaxID=2767595 RepID=A0ABR9B8K7_9RHOO|nr:transposase [Thauera sedimentorum]MBC9071771.1 transposase [Thauera sedimentorum]MBD8502690.1 transposase [Thauera sedimentorum]
MRGQLDPQSSMFHYFSHESRVPADHPLRRVKKLADRALAAISADLNALYSSVGRPSIPPEPLLKGQLLIALYTIRSDRQFCEQLDYNILFHWFLDMNLESASLDRSNFSRLRERLVATDVARRSFDEVVCLARRQQLLSSDHFTVDGTLIDAWASFKSFRRKDGEPPKDGGDGTGMVDFKGEKRATDKGYHVKDFVGHLREHRIRQRIARVEGRKTPGLDRRTTRTEAYQISQRKRKRVEEIFGWLKTVGGMRKSRFIGQAKTQMAAFISGAEYNLLRIAELSGSEVKA